MRLGAGEIILIVAALFLLFGASRLPQLAKAFGQTRKAFKEGLREKEDGERIEPERKRFNQSPLAAPARSSNLSDDEIRAAMSRRIALKQQNEI